MKITFPAIDSGGTALVATVAVGVCGLLLASPATAQPAPSTPPSYATSEERIRGRITAFDGKYSLQVRDERGYVDNVNLHDGTVINPTGLRLAPGQSVTIVGHNSGKAFEANEIDTPYTSYGADPAYAYGYAPYAYAPYGYYPYGYRPYPAFGFGFRDRGFGVRGWF